MSLKQAAEELLKIADEIEKEAEEVTQFVCEKCNHTAALATINTMRKEAAESAEETITVADVTVNDSIQCPACDGLMSYKATEASESYYFDPEKKASEDGDEDDEGGDEDKEEKSASSEPIDYDSLERYTA